MHKRLNDLPYRSLLQLYRGFAYALWVLGAFLGIIAVVPRVLELKGQPLENLTVLGIAAVILLLTLGCVFSLSRLSSELERRLGQS